MIRRRAKDQLAGSDDGSDETRALQIHIFRGGERQSRWCGDADTMTFRDVIRGHESVEERVLFLSARRCGVPVPRPRDGGIGAIRRCGDADTRADPSSSASDP